MPERIPFNVSFNSPGGMTYNEYFDHLVTEGKISPRGLKDGATYFNEMITDEEWDDRFVEAAHRIDQVEYYLDELWYADWPEREIIMNDLQSDMERIAKKPEISRLFSPEGPSL